MCRERSQSRFRGFFSLDAAFAMVVAVFAYASFSLLLSAAASSAASGASERASSLLALRFSNYAMSESSVGGSAFFGSGYYKAWEIDPVRLSELDLQGVLQRAGRKYAKVSLYGGEGELFSKGEGTPQGASYCASRLALLSGKTVRLEACIS